MKKLTYKQLCWLVFWLWLGFVVGMSAFVSHEIAAHPKAQAFADWMAQWIPMLDNIRKIPNSTEWVRFYYAVFWAISPVFIILSWFVSNQYMKVKSMPPISAVKWIFSCFGIFAFAIIIVLWPVADGLGWRDQSMATNIIGVGYHSLMMVFVWLLLGGQLRGSYYFIFHGAPYWPTGSKNALSNGRKK